ncbi:MAG: double-strand break repair protein AddB, partial [Alphaproteobacteria bacterium]
MSAGKTASTLRDKPVVYTIPAGVSFLDALAEGVLARYPDPMALAELRILLPNRRSARALEAAFLRHADTPALLLPRIEVLGDLEEEVLEATLAQPQDQLLATPAIGQVERLLLLAPLVAAFLEKTQAAKPSGTQIHALTAALARLADALALGDADLAGLESIVPAELSAHWQRIATFLEILREAWPAILAERGRLDPGARQVALLRALKEAWTAAPPSFPVIAAGSTGSVPATAELLALVARLPEGCVVLPALDRNLDDQAWQALLAEDHLTHPQYQLAKLLTRIGIRRADVADWPSARVAAAMSRPGHRARLALLSAALHPEHLAPCDPAIAERARDGLALITCHDRREEALAAALLLREVLEMPDRTAALVTPDRALAEAVHAQLMRWGIEVDDSAGRPLATTPVGTLMTLVLEVVAEDFAPVPLLALLKHPLVRLGERPAAIRRFARRLDRHRRNGRWLLRGPRVAGGLAGLIHEAGALSLAEEDIGRLQRLRDVFSPLLALQGRGDDHPPLSSWAEAHLAVLEALAADERGRCDALWAREAGEAASRLMADVSQAACGACPTFTLDQYRGFLSGLVADTVVRRPYGGHPRLMILGTIEARLLHPDRLILAGLNEESWPPAVAIDPWLNRRMRAAIGLPQPERRIGQSAHDFYAAAAGPEVFLLRAEKIDGVQTTPARWLQRLSVLLPGLEVLARRHPLLTQLRALDRPERITPCSVPAPAPPPALRPKEISVTAVERLMRDPYAFHARHILKLQPLEPLDAEPDALARGNLLHDILHRYLADRLRRRPEAPEGEYARLLAMAEKAFAAFASRPLVRALWWPRFERLARIFIEELTTDEARGRHPVLLEREGRLPLLDGRILLTAKA